MPAIKLWTHAEPADELPPVSKAETLSAFFKKTYLPYHPQLKQRTKDDYGQQIKKFEKWLERPATLDDLCDDQVAGFLAALVTQPRQQPATIKKSRATLLTLWRFAWAKLLVDQPPRLVPKITCPKPRPKAWRTDELSKIIAVCAEAKPFVPRGRAAHKKGEWDRRHWIATVLTLYDTSLRINALLHVPVANLDRAAGLLRTEATWHKHRNDEEQPLHADTLQAIDEMLATRPWRMAGRQPPPGELLFAWPMTPAVLFRHYKAILIAAGLPHGPKDMFHKIRRTTYTNVKALQGAEAASSIAGHSADLSAFYEDVHLAREIKGQPSPMSILPRPKAAKLNGKQLELF